MNYRFLLFAVVTGLSGYAAWAAPAEQGLIAHWSFDEGTGTVARDSSGSGGDCDLKGAKGATGPSGAALDFAGRDSFVEARDPHTADLKGAFTISFWMNPAIWADQYSSGVMSKKINDSAHGYVIYGDGFCATKITLRIAGTVGGHAMLTSASDVDEETWQHWAVTYDAGTQTVAWYKNGRLDKTYANIAIGDTSNDTPLQIGHAHTWNGYFNGRLAEIAIYDRALTAAEIAGLSHGTGPAPVNAAVPLKWRLASTRYPADDPVVAACTVKEAGAKGDGRTDDTAAFQAALSSVGRAGGGTVFVPEGRYAIRGNLQVPVGVTLRGEWERPRPGVPLRGTLLMAYAGRGDAEGRPFIALRQSSGVKDLAVWYPDQNPRDIVPYPFCIEQMGVASGTVQNVTLVNPYQGIRTDNGSALHYHHNVYGSPLSIGIEIDYVCDSGRVDSIDFNPDYWSWSGLPGAPPASGPHATWMRANGTGMVFRRYEWIFSAFVKLRGYATGVRMFNSKVFGETNGQMYDYAISDCTTAVDITDANFAGISFTKCLLSGSDYGVLTRPAFNSFLLFHSCKLSGGKRAALLDGVAEQSVIFRQCSFTGGVERVRGDLVMLGCAVESPGDHLRLGRDARAVTIAGTEFNGTPRIVNDCGSGRVTISSEAVPAVKLPAIARPADRRLQPSKPLLFMVAARPRANTQALEGDDTGAIQAALDQAGKAGGGVVLLPAGVYSLRGHLTVPSGVELRGVCEVEHHSRAWGTVVRVYAGRGEANGAPAIAMAANSGLRGLTFYYPEQRYEAIVPYPFLVQGRGAGIWVVNVTGTNPYQFLDFRTCRCDRHHIEYAAGAPLRVGVAVGGGSVGGEVLNVQFNPHYWAWCPFPDCPGVSNDELAHHLNPVWAYQYQNLEGFVFGDCQDEYQFENAVFGSRIGLHFVSENGTGAAGVVLGHGTDGSMVSMAFDGLGPKGVDVLNSQLVAMDAAGVPSTTEKTYVRCGANLRSTARLVNTTLWGYPVNAVVVHGGTLDMDMSGFRMYGPLLVDGGQLNVAASLFVQQMTGVRELAVSGEGKASLLGNLAPQGMRANPDAPAGSVEERLGNRRP